MPFIPFNSITTPLHQGVNLIEASAGTGKTYTIAMLALRFVVEQDISLENLLVVTFTKAATEELKDRIRARLAEARRAVVGNGNAIDSNMRAWLNSLVLPADIIKQRLDNALLTIDQASILTIHGFCQRILQERPLESGQLFSSELLEDVQPIHQQCADDFWRRQIYPRSIWEAAVLTTSYKTPEALLASIAYFAPHITVYPDYCPIEPVLANLKRCVAAASKVWHPTVTALQASFTEGKFKISLEDFTQYAEELKGWLHGDSHLLPSQDALHILTEQGLTEALNGHKFRATKTESSAERKANYLASLSLSMPLFDQLATAVNHCTLVLRRALLEDLRVAVDKHMQQHNLLSFDSLIFRLADALQGNNSALLVHQVRQDFKVALIDEFQDTDATQWLIFSRLFAAPTQYLYLIGDPKQAIYKFRGADIYSYLAAQKIAEHQFTLASNWRSHPQLVAAVNQLFQRSHAFFLDGLHYSPVTAGLSVQHGQLCQADRPMAPMVLWQLPPSESSKGYWKTEAASALIRESIVEEIVQLLTQDYRWQPHDQRLQLKDIAILVRNNRQAREYQVALRAANIPSVLNSMESVFSTQEATDLYFLLRAIAEPGNSTLFKQAMTLDWFGLDGQGFYRFINDETAVDDYMVRFFNYHQEWQKVGLMAMMRQVMAQENIQAHLSTTVMAERQLTNLQHLLELVQQAATSQRFNSSKTVEWLRTAIQQARPNENQQLRLESDDNAVKIVTTHRSKGLEYHIVFCPYLWQRGREDVIAVCHENGRMVADLGSADFERHRLQANNEALAEDLRVLYVAVTRAKYRCYLAWADVRTEKIPNQSALAWLLDFGHDDFATQQAKLKNLTTEFDQVFAYQLLNTVDRPLSRYDKPVERVELQARKRHRSLYTAWQISSYTALSALTLQDTPVAVDENDDTQATVPDLSPMDLPKGAQTGNVIHELLENNSFKQLARHKDISVQKINACLRYGLKLEQPEVLDDLLYAVVSTPLSVEDNDFCLMNLHDQHCLKEMPFYLALQSINTQGINYILQDSPAFQPLSHKAIAGYLTGFIDLVCEYQGRYYVMDYKTNLLPDYSEESLLQAMREHNYGLQYWLYSVVLHRYLQLRLPGYSYQSHFGGIRYLFVRGMQPELPMRGVFQDRPTLEKITALATLFQA